MTQKIRKFLSTAIKHHLVETGKLLWQFKWYIICDAVIFIIFLWGYFDPPAVDDPIWNSEHMGSVWYYQSQKHYLLYFKYHLMIGALLFLIGTSNMRTHPKLAKLIFVLVILGLISNVF